MAETATVDNLDIQIAASTNTAESALSKLASMLGEISEKLTEMTGVLKGNSKAASASSKAVKQVGHSMSSLSKTATKAAKSLGDIPRAFGRIALYRAIRSVIKNLSAAIKEGLTNLKSYSDVVGTAFSPAVDNLRQHVLMLKNAFATALRPIIEALIPLVIQLVNWFSKLADFAAQVFSVLTGKVDDKGRYTKAVLGDLEQSNKQAKQLRRTLLGFDEINRLDAPDSGSGEKNNAVTMFTQAEISDNAKEVAGRIQVIIDKVAEIGQKVKAFINENPWILTLAEILLGASIASGVLKKVFEGILGVLHTLMNPLTLIIAFITASALYGDKIKAWLDDLKPKVFGLFDKLEKKLKNLPILKAIVQLAKNIYGSISDLVGDIASLIYHLVHKDYDSALEDVKRIGWDVIEFLASIFIGLWNILAGIFEWIALGAGKLVTWFHNEVLVPVGNWIYTAIENVKIWGKNFGVNFKIFWVSLAKFFVERLNDALSVIEEDVNSAIEIINWAFGTDLQPVHFEIDTSGLDAKLIELRDTKLDPITETIEFYTKWEQPTKPDFQIDTTKALEKLKNLYNEATKTAQKISTISGAFVGQKTNNNAARYVSQYASGGYPDIGSIFIAGESGAEWVGDINGRTGVMNTDQMAAAMYNAMVAALSTMPNSGGDIYLDGEVIYRNVVNRNNNQVRSTGRAALLT